MHCKTEQSNTLEENEGGILGDVCLQILFRVITEFLVHEYIEKYLLTYTKFIF